MCCKEFLQAKYHTFKYICKAKKRAFLLAFAPFCIFWLIRIYLKLIRIEVQTSKEVLKKLEKNIPFCIAFWHGELLLQPYAFNKFCKDKSVYVLISQHFDGEIISKTMEYFNIHSLRGSSSKGGIRALLNAIKTINANNLVAITPDGPKGPYHSIADGIILLAQKSQTKIVISRIICANAWTFPSWDKFKIPKPFSKITFIIKEPVSVANLTLDSAKAYLKEKMEEDGA